jgi:hypothetical protein
MEVQMRSPRRFHPVRLVAAAAGILVTSTSAYAQDGFSFKPPAVTLDFTVGHIAQSTGSDVYSDLTTNLTLEKKDFAATSYAGSAAFRATPRTDFVISVAYARSYAPSESRDYEGTDDLPITQTTALVRVPVTAGLRYFPVSRGRSIGQYAFIPAAFTPFIGGGLGLMNYKLTQVGDFVDTEDLSIFTDELESSGRSVMAYGEAGAAYWFSPRVGVTADARYNWSRAPMRRDFERFDNIDLRGVQATAGLAVRF